MSTIVMAVIAVLILIILASIVIRNLGNTSAAVDRCESVSGICSIDRCGDRFDGYLKEHPTAKCLDGNAPTGEFCCVPG